ncbi:MFS transporter [Spelaeicoccus albus]|uniref:MFS transporter n=1 Tax=Spelaeicoccus albus TaxID=1280376 RepID=UPI0015CABA51|nr:MFS transporter [Spelaeicoccus albus]
MSQVVIRSKNDVVNFINNHPQGSGRGKIIAWIALGSIFIDAYDFTSLSIGLGSLKAEFNPSSFQLGALTASIAVGALVGALVGGRLVDRLGRYKLLILDLILFVAAAVAAGLAPNIELLLVFRFLLGIGVGIDMPAALSLISEFSRTRDKGKYVNFWQLIWYCATVISALLTLPIISLAGEEHLWRWAVGFGAVPAAVILVLRLIYADESPTWAAASLSLRKSVDILRKNYDDEFVVEDAHSDGPTKQVKVTAIFSKTYRLRTLVASVVSGFQAVQYFAVGFYLPVIIGMILGQHIVQIVIGTAIINVFGLLGGGIQPFVTWRLGLRRLAIIGCAICIAVLLAIGLLPRDASPYFIGLLLGIFIFAHSFGPGAQGKSIAALSYPTELRGLGTGFAEAMSRVGSIIGFFVFPLVLAAAGVSGTMLWFCLVPLIMLVTLLFVRWEPSGKNVEDYEDTAVRSNA